MDSFSIRPATTDDLPAIVAIEKSIHEKCAATGRGHSLWTAEHFQSELEKPHSLFWVFTDDETDETVAAYLVAWKLFDEIQILTIAVDFQWRGQGFAKALLKKLVSWGARENVKKLTLEVRKSNEAALGLYQDQGFLTSHIRQGFYKDKSSSEDAYHMELALSDNSLSLSAEQ